MFCSRVNVYEFLSMTKNVRSFYIFVLQNSIVLVFFDKRDSENFSNLIMLMLQQYISQHEENANPVFVTRAVKSCQKMQNTFPKISV